jgi:hypothetical protein
MCLYNKWRQFVLLTKNLIDGNIVYTHTTSASLAEYSFDMATKKVTIEENDKAKLKQMLKKKRQKGRVSLMELLEPIKPEIMYNRVVFEPYVRYSEQINNVFNLFTGFHAQPNNEIVNINLIAPLLTHMKHILCGDNIATYEYMLNWLAHLCQKPYKKIGVMIALMSSHQGAGKNVFWDFVGNYIVGKNHYMVLNDLDQLTGKFNSVLENKILTVCDEIGNFGGAHRSNDKLKNIITQGEQIIERKGFDSIRVNDYNNFVGLSNNDWPWKIECGDRRHLVLEVSNAKVGDTAYFKQLTACMTDECGLHFYNMLLRRDITNWSPMDIPMTEFKRDLKLMSAPPAVRYIVDCLRRSDPHGFSWTDAGPTSVFSTTLYEGFQLWQKNTGDDRERLSFTQFIRSLRHIGLHTKNVTLRSVQKKGITLDKEKLLINIRAYLKDASFDITED